MLLKGLSVLVKLFNQHAITANIFAVKNNTYIQRWYLAFSHAKYVLKVDGCLDIDIVSNM